MELHLWLTFPSISSVSGPPPLSWTLEHTEEEMLVAVGLSSGLWRAHEAWEKESHTRVAAADCMCSLYVTWRVKKLEF